MKATILWTLAWEAVWLACVLGIDTNMYVGTGPDRWMKDRTPAIWNSLGAAFVATAVMGLGRIGTARWIGTPIWARSRVLLVVLLAMAVTNGSVVAASIDTYNPTFAPLAPGRTGTLRGPDYFLEQMFVGFVTAAVTGIVPLFVLWKTSHREANLLAE